MVVKSLQIFCVLRAMAFIESRGDHIQFFHLLEQAWKRLVWRVKECDLPKDCLLRTDFSIESTWKKKSEKITDFCLNIKETYMRGLQAADYK